MTEQIEVEVAYALPEQQFVIPVTVKADVTIEQVIQQSGILQKRREIDLAVNRVGIFGRMMKLTDTVNDGDRIEIYRPLKADPKEIRRRRAAEQAKLAKKTD